MSISVATVIGNLVADPELRFTQSGTAVVGFTIASTPRKYDRASGEYVDGDPLFLDCTLWRDAAENVAESLSKGDRVVAYGKLKQSSWEDKDGNKRSKIEMDVEEVGPSLKFATAKPQKATKGGGAGGAGVWG